MLVKASVLADLQRRVLKAEAGLREKEEENDLLHQRVEQYETRWSEYEQKMRSMEEVWQRQMRSLQSSLSAAKKSLANDHADGSPDAGYLARLGTPESSGLRPALRITDRGLSHLGEEFERRRHEFDDGARSVQLKSSSGSDLELRRLKQAFNSWKKDFASRLRQTRADLHRPAGGETNLDRSVKKWWGRLNSKRTM